MYIRHRIAALPLSVVALSLVACGDKPPLQAGQMRTAQIMKDDKSQVALLLNKDLSITVASVEAGLRARPCATEPDKKNSADGENNPLSSHESCLPAGKAKGEVFYQKTFTISVIRGSCCAYISSGDQTYELCSGPNVPPDFPVEFINQITGQTCPSG